MRRASAGRFSSAPRQAMLRDISQVPDMMPRRIRLPGFLIFAAFTERFSEPPSSIRAIVIYGDAATRGILASSRFIFARIARLQQRVSAADS